MKQRLFRAVIRYRWLVFWLGMFVAMAVVTSLTDVLFRKPLEWAQIVVGAAISATFWLGMEKSARLLGAGKTKR